MKKIFTIVFINIFLISFTDPYTIKRVSDKEYRYEFYTTDKVSSIKNTKKYYWFKGGLIHSSQGGVAGQLLNDDFKKFYHSNQLAEQGKFKKGLKVGLWKTWFQNGTLETTQKFSNGLSSGDFQKFDGNGNIIEKGKFKKGKKHGQWVNYISKDTIQFKNGEIFIPKPKLTKEEKALAKEAKFKEKEALKLQKEKEKELKKAEKEKSQNQKGKSKESPKEKNKKENFFTRLFSKKEK
ncbi:hypothetical protein FIA58_020035 [Flavobacterium jejuense]|uniref:MORN repeat protein n=1 Tax=Flavobacterium jejuense TaxID=1544455 RepID=A0ABX0J244_9FLAO|nr:hypothetical protein [Flavobacterium jejuense]NHN27975.1 hypothetical protein [Flavobacterium jejuense]